eukprot:symbB.v1.2.031863.t2/scaffold3678.1/size52145/3
MSACAKARQPDHVAKLMQDLRDKDPKGVLPNHWNSLIISCAPDGERANRAMQEGLGKYYRSLMVCHRNPAEQQKIYRLMRQEFPRTDPEEAWAILLRTAVLNEDAEAVQWLDEEMHSHGCPMDSDRVRSVPPLRRAVQMLREWQQTQQLRESMKLPLTSTKQAQPEQSPVQPEKPLPSGWQSTIDPATGHPYYWRGRPQGQAVSAAHTTRNRPPPQDYLLQQGLYRRPHNSMPVASGPTIQVQQQQIQQQQIQQQVRQLQHSSHPLPQSRAQDSQLSKLPVQYNFGGSTASARRKEKHLGSAEYSDDDELGPSLSFKKKKLSLLVRCISYVHQEITSGEAMSSDAMELQKLYSEEQYHTSHRTDLRGWRRSLGDTNPLEVANFILGIFENGFFEVSELICSLIFLRRFREKTGLRMDPACWRPLFLASLLVTDKYLIDSSVKGSSMSEQSMFPVLTPSQVFALELTFWKKLDFGCLWLTRQDFKSFCQELELHVPESMELARFVWMLRSWEDFPGVDFEDRF